jgi:hypothetical protein
MCIFADGTFSGDRPKQHGTFFDKKRPTAEFANVYDETGDRKACHVNFAIDYPAASPNGGPKNARSVNCVRREALTAVLCPAAGVRDMHGAAEVRKSVGSGEADGRRLCSLYR